MRLAVAIAAWLAASGCSGGAAQSATNERDGGKLDAAGPEAGQDAKQDGTSCEPVTCAAANADCGQMPNGCGGVTECGSCAAGKYCGGAGPNRCGDTPCDPITCASKGYECGTMSDGCSATLQCGSCAGPNTCGGGGTPHKCGCLPGSCGSVQCGVIDDDCVGAIDCGSCGSGQSCLDHKCCSSSTGAACTKQCHELQGPVRGYSQFASVWCSSQGQSQASVTNCSEPDPDPCTTAGQAPGCGLVPGYAWCDVTCHHNYDCEGTTLCDGTCG